MSSVTTKKDGGSEAGKPASVSPPGLNGNGMTPPNGAGRPLAEQSGQDPESDVDELVDSDAEEAPNGSAKPAQSGTGKVGRPKGSKTKKPTATLNGNGASGHARQRSEAEAKQRSEGSVKSTKDGASSRPTSKPASRRASPARGPSTSSEAAPPLPADAAKSYAGPSSSREMLGRTATGGPVPYYYPQTHVGNDNRASHSPQDIVYGKSKAHGGADAAASEVENLSGQEVDKFLDLIEKYNLDTSNEDDMARSVTELYQEWLEWCAKRNVISTKSKQHLVGEFGRIHNGAYGPVRQQRAMDIVQGSRTFHSAGSANAAFDRAANGASSRAPPRSQFVPPTVPRDLDKNGRGRTHDLRNTPPRGGLLGRGPGSPSGPPVRGPHSPIYEDPFARGIPPALLDQIHQQVRDEVLREADIMVQQILQQNLGELVTENQGMARRIEQLEQHSDNLAQWVQHLNRVQEDTVAAVQAPLPIREERLDEARMPREPFRPGQGHRDGYGPGAGPGSGPAYRHASPKRAYGGGMPPRASMSPAMTHRSAGRAPGPPGHHMVPHDAYERQGGPPVAMGMTGHMPPPGGVSGPPPPSNHGASFRGASPRSAHAYAAAAHGGNGGGGPMQHMYNDGMVGGGGPPPPPGAMEGRGGYYNGPPFDERSGLPPPPPGSHHAYDHHGPMHPVHHPSSPPRQMKRARNGY